MPTLSERAANVALYSFEPAQLAPDTFEVLRFEGTEGISQLFSFELQLVSESPDVDFAKVVNKPATFTMMRGDQEVPINGIVTDFSQHGRTADYVTYRATLQPRLQRLSLSFGSRIFQEKKVEDILRTVLEEGGLSSSDFRFALQGSYSPREYCVQYQETDLNFVNRLMEFEGMYYFFEHGDGQDTLVITDKKSEHEKISEPAALRYHGGAGGMVDEDVETVKQFVCEEKVVTGTVRLRDYNYRKPDTMTVESQMNSEMPGTQYEYGEHFRETDRGKRLAEVRNEEIEARRRVLTGESNSMGFQGGYLFTLENHYRKSLNADYLLTQIEHRGSQRAGMDIDALQARQDGEPEAEYRNQFTCIPATVQYRPPRRTPKPEVPGVLTAKVESAGGDYAYIDDQGRYRAKMHFDLRDDRSDGTNTLPIRMKQANTGPDYGIHFPNHAETELLVAFENGDIDRPIALGTTPNPSQSSPVTSENKTQNLIRSYADNEVLVEDQEGETEIRLTTTDGHQTSLHDGKKHIRIQTTDGHIAQMDDKDKFITVVSKDAHGLLINDKGGDNEASDEGVELFTKSGDNLTINDTDNYIKINTDKKNYIKLDDDNKKMTMETKNGHSFVMDYKKKNIGIESEGGHSIFINDKGSSEGISHSTKSGHSLNLNDKDKIISLETSGGYVINMDDNGSEIEIEAGSNEIELDDTKGKVEIEAGKEIKLKCGQSSISLKKSGKIEIKGLNIEVKGTKSVKLKGMNISSKANVKNDIKGTMINSKAKAINKIKGSLTKIG